MRDGVHLFTSVYSPKDKSKRGLPYPFEIGLAGSLLGPMAKTDVPGF